LKKRSKKLLPMARRPQAAWVAALLPETDKSILVLFCKKERL
jgi:hypothetical protein